ncbi:aldo/keto reductase [Phytoactinopolyspora endophytica]|uniref:aldo/keto reductase n=1 Tax=Phytoactinopolyspora endophytica TaxID=1642495 RepID=UPI00197B8DA2|nr:aldo/keto reductase [Phytoactinopolyspora endophytica]
MPNLTWEHVMDDLTPDPQLYNVPFRADEYRGMPYRYVGASGLRASAIGLGTWKFGYPGTGDGARVGEEDALALLDRAAELGVTLWDTANRYNAASGNSERVIGQWLARHPGRRRDVVLATKTFGGMDGTTPNHSGLSRLQIIQSVKASLARMQTDYIDLLWFHGFDDHVPVAESLETVEDLISQGLVNYLAVSNVEHGQLSAYLDVAGTLSRRVRPVAVQNRYDPLNGETRPGVLELSAGEGIAFVPYSPLAQGLLTDRYLDPAAAGPGDRLYDEGLLDGVATAENLKKVRRLAELARLWRVPISTMVLAYILTLPGMGPQIPSSSTIDQLEANTRAGTTALTRDQTDAVHDVFTG